MNLAQERNSQCVGLRRSQASVVSPGSGLSPRAYRLGPVASGPVPDRLARVPVVYVNGRITDAAEAVVPVFDHGFLYGEGVYETLRTYGGEPFLFPAHMKRLRRSGAMIHLDVPGTDDEMMQKIRATMAAERGLKEAYIRILITRGVGELTYNLAATPVPSTIIIVKPFPE